jgi:hypothetical protein
LVSIIRRVVVHPVTSLRLPLVALSAVSVGDLAMVPLGSRQPVLAPLDSLASEEPTWEAPEAPAQETLDADHASLGPTNIKVDGADPQPSDDTRGLLQHLVMHGANIGVRGSTTPGDAALAPSSSGTAGPRLSELLLLGSVGFLRSPIKWRRVGDHAEFVYS